MTVKSPLNRYAFRKLRTRQYLFGTAERPRLAVYRSNKHITAQMVDDASGRTLLTVTSTAKVHEGKGSTISAARTVGKALAEKAKSKGIDKAVFDRGARPYHGRVKALADGAREAGLQF